MQLNGRQRSEISRRAMRRDASRSEQIAFDRAVSVGDQMTQLLLCDVYAIWGDRSGSVA
jgi:hypothetical protein